MGGSHRVDYSRVPGKRDKEEVAPLVGPRLAQLARAPDCRLETLGCRQPSGGPRFKSGSADQTSLWRCATLKRGRARRMVQAPPSLRELRCHYAPKQKIEIMPIKTQYSDSWTPLIAPRSSLVDLLASIRTYKHQVFRGFGTVISTGGALNE